MNFLYGLGCGNSVLQWGFSDQNGGKVWRFWSPCFKVFSCCSISSLAVPWFALCQIWPHPPSPWLLSVDCTMCSFYGPTSIITTDLGFSMKNKTCSCFCLACMPNNNNAAWESHSCLVLVLTEQQQRAVVDSFTAAVETSSTVEFGHIFISRTLFKG